MPEIEEQDGDRVPGEGLSSYDVSRLILRLAIALDGSDLNTVINKLQDRAGNLRPFWNKHFCDIMDVFDLWERVALEQGHVISAIKSMRNRLGWGLKECKDATVDYRARIAAEPLRAYMDGPPLWQSVSRDPISVITFHEQKLIKDYLVSRGGYWPWQVMSPMSDNQQYEIVKHIAERNEWSLIEAKLLFEAVAKAVKDDGGHIDLILFGTKPDEAEESVPEDESAIVDLCAVGDSMLS